MAEALGKIKEQLESLDWEQRLQKMEEYRQDERAGVKKLLEKYERAWNDYQEEIRRTQKMYEFERKNRQYTYICGVDEVGRGPVAGPVMAGAVILPVDHEILYLNDSKKLTKKKREEMYELLKKEVISFGIGETSSEQIDEKGIAWSVFEAMRQAIGKLSVTPDLILVDAFRIPDITIPQINIIKGDAKSASIAAASIMAKVTRDRLMEEYDEKYPGYEFGKHAGYGTKAHMDAIQKHGMCPIHRKTFIH